VVPLAACVGNAPPPLEVDDIPPSAAAASHPDLLDVDEPLYEGPWVPTLGLKGLDPDDSVAAAQEFLEVFNHTIATGDGALLDRHCHPQATYCHDVVRGAEHRTADGVTIVGGAVTFDDARLVDVDDIRDIWTVRVAYEQAEIEVHEPDGTTRTIDASDGDLDVRVTHWPSRGWLLRDITAADDVDE